MDRFIALTTARPSKELKTFKIQYGQIYSLMLEELYQLSRYLKSNMDRFIVKEYIEKLRCKK